MSADDKGRTASVGSSNGSAWIAVSERKPTASDMPVMVLEKPTKNNIEGRGRREPLEMSVVFFLPWFEDENLEGNGILYWWPINPPPQPTPNNQASERRGENH